MTADDTQDVWWLDDKLRGHAESQGVKRVPLGVDLKRGESSVHAVDDDTDKNTETGGGAGGGARVTLAIVTRGHPEKDIESFRTAARALATFSPEGYDRVGSVTMEREVEPSSSEEDIAHFVIHRATIEGYRSNSP